MRVLFAITVVAISLVGVAGASAGAYSPDHYEYAERAGMLCIYDDEPGVAIRPYWLAPWRHHHYFPRPGAKPRFGRRENLSVRSYPKNAQTERAWSNEWAFADEPLALSPIAAPPLARAK